MDDPGDLLGLLDGQRMRATRVVLDIGVHLRKPAPERWGGGIWDADKAWVSALEGDSWEDASTAGPASSNLAVDSLR